MTKQDRKSGWPAWAWLGLVVICANFVFAFKAHTYPNWERLPSIALIYRLQEIPDAELRLRSYATLKLYGTNKASYSELLYGTRSDRNSHRLFRTEVSESDAAFLSQLPFYSANYFQHLLASKICYAGLPASLSLDVVNLLSLAALFIALGCFMASRINPLLGLGLIFLLGYSESIQSAASYGTPDAPTLLFVTLGLLLSLSGAKWQAFSFVPLVIAVGFKPEAVILGLSILAYQIIRFPKEKLVPSLGILLFVLVLVVSASLTKSYPYWMTLTHTFKGPFSDISRTQSAGWSLGDQFQFVGTHFSSMLQLILVPGAILGGLLGFAIVKRNQQLAGFVCLILVLPLIQFVVFPLPQPRLYGLLPVGIVIVIVLLLESWNQSKPKSSGKERKSNPTAEV